MGEAEERDGEEKGLWRREWFFRDGLGWRSSWVFSLGHLALSFSKSRISGGAGRNQAAVE